MSQLGPLIKRIFPFQITLPLPNETEQAFFRIAICALLFVFFLITDELTNGAIPPAILFIGIYALFGIVILWWMYRYHPHKVALRLVMMGLDLSIISAALYFSEEYGSVLFGVYLWVVLGNGFRYGKFYLYAGTAMCLTGFITVFALSDYWAAHRAMGIGWIIGLIILPLFVNRLINRLHALIEQANKANVAAETANHAKSIFFARMSHDLRTPMNNVLATTDILRNSKGLPAEHKELLHLIQDSAQVSLRLIDNVLDFAKLEAGKLTVDAHPFELQQLIAASMRMVASAARDKKLRLLITTSPKMPNNVVGDAHHLRMVLMNLLTNAIKFTETGYVALKVEPVSETPDAVTLRFSIHDTGIGIGPVALEHIWETFRQEHEQITRRYGGTGLGTTIAKQLVELMGGRIAVTSIQGKGSLFWFEVPLARYAAVANVSVVRPARVLLLSEDTTWVDTLRAGIAPSSAKIFVANSAEDVYAAFARAARFGRSWHVVLADDLLVRRQGGVRCEAAFMDTAQAMAIPMYLMTDVPYHDNELWERGYCGALPRTDLAMITALTTAPRINELPDEDPSVVRVAPWIWAGARKSAPRILIADDNCTNRKVLTIMLESAGYAVDAVADGESALQKLTTGDYKAVVLDLHMPEMDGMEVVQHYKAMLPGKTRPMVILSSDTTAVSRVELAMAGANIYLTKPVRSDVLVATLERLIGEQDVVSLILNNENTADPSNTVSRVLDMDVLADLERICKDTKELTDVVKSFETEADTLMVRIDKAVNSKHHETLAEFVQAMKGIAANLGAVQVVAVCDRMLDLSPLEASAMADALAGELREAYFSSRDALYELIGSPQLSRV